MSGNFRRFLWLEGVFDEKSVTKFQSISPASNFWQKGFIRALQESGNYVSIVGYPVERAWPFGRWRVRGSDAALLPGVGGQLIGYLNLPYFRAIIQFVGLRLVLASVLRSGQPLPDYLVVFSCLERSSQKTAAIRVAKWVRRKFGIPWVCIVADGESPPGADAYVYLPWACYESALKNRTEPTIHIDGGVAQVPVNADLPSAGSKKALMYMGALTAHGGALELAKAFRNVQGDNFSLWFCGRGTNSELVALAALDNRIEIKGFLEEDALNRLAAQAFAFANPRPVNFMPNKLNYPSKLLHYLAFGKPVISTFTDGVSPEYKQILISLNDVTQSSLSAGISEVMNLDAARYRELQARIAEFNRKHSWTAQVDRFMLWLQREFPRG